MTCASEDDTWVTRFSNIQLSCWETVLFKYFILNQKYNFPSLEKRCGILFWRVQRFIIKPKSLFGCQRAHKEKAFRWVRCVNQKYAEYFQLLWNFQKQHQYLQGPPFILLKGKLGNWQFNLALENRWITQGGVGWSKPSLDFHVWRPKYKVLLGVSAKIPTYPAFSSWAVFRCSLQQLKRPISTKRVTMSEHTAPQLRVHLHFISQVQPLCPLAAGRLWGRYGSWDYLLPLKELIAKKRKTKWRKFQMMQDWS